VPIGAGRRRPGPLLCHRSRTARRPTTSAGAGRKPAGALRRVVAGALLGVLGALLAVPAVAGGEGPSWRPRVLVTEVRIIPVLASRPRG
jgi:hypothetical protein